ncbi:MAG: hypothetical protein L7F78_12920, partial [Syntrophales bacterium LBB04]|nr:hypothetical protein [Syntrophales bacterium LBB04]
MGYPIGIRNLEGYPIVLAVALLHKFSGISYLDCIQLLLSFFILLGSSSLIWAVWKVSTSIFAGLLATLLFYGSVFMLAFTFYGDLYPGLLLFPFFVVSGLVFLQRIQRALHPLDLPKLALFSILPVLILEFAIMTSGYVYVIAIATLGAWCLITFAASLWTTHRLDRSRLALLLIWVLILLLPGFIYQSLVFKVPAPPQPLRTFRGQSVDLITMFVPTQRWLVFADLLHLGPLEWNGPAFYGNGQNANPNYVGIIGPILGFVAVLLAAFNKFKLRRIMVTLGILWSLGFLLSLGPSLKINDTRPLGPTPGYSIWDMAPQWATLSFPWANIFRLPVISTMRYTYRWQLMSRLSLAVLLGLFLPQLFARKKVLAVVFCVALLFENLPVDILTAQANTSWNRSYGQQFISKVIVPLRPYIENRRVLFLPSGNDYLITLVAPLTDSYTYNLSFDKELYGGSKS